MNINLAYIFFLGWLYSVAGEPERSELKMKHNRLKVPRVKTKILIFLI